VDRLGWLGSLLLAFCGLPEAYRAITANNYDISIPFILMWGIGELLLLLPAIKDIKKNYLIFNYSANIFFILIILGRVIYDKAVY